MKAARHFVIPLSAVAALLPAVVYATNGMNLEGYGPVATGMGGASMAYDNGSAAMMNNPATIGLMPDGNRADFALGLLGPDVTAKRAGQPDAKSSGTAYYMPALGWLSKQGDLAYGVGVFSQGGMGTEYKADSFMAAGSGEKARSEVGVGRLMVPVAYNVNPEFTIGGSVDLVWAGMDIKMAMLGSDFGDMVAAFPTSKQSAGTASGTMVDGLVSKVGNFMNNGFGAGAGMGTGPVNWARFDFSNSNAFTGEAKGTGFAGKIGGVYRPNQQLAIGATYHTKTSLSDLKSSNATVTMNANVDSGMAAGGPASGVYVAKTIAVTGKIKVIDFEWPAFFGIGAAFQATDQLMIAADVKRIQWADVMKNFHMEFTADAVSAQAGLAQGFGGAVLDATLFQKWDDQTVIALGGSYKVDPAWTVRLGYNHASNPIPDTYLNALFPAIEETHVTAGVGFEMSKASSFDFSLTDGLEKKATNSQNQVASTMSQLNWQFMYSYRY